MFSIEVSNKVSFEPGVRDAFVVADAKIGSTWHSKIQYQLG